MNELNQNPGIGEYNCRYQISATSGITTKLIKVIKGNLNTGEKVKELKEIIQNKRFNIVSKNIEKGTLTKVYEKIRKTDDEYDENLNGAKALNMNGYDVYILPKLQDVKSFDYILVKDNKVYAAELKTIYGENSLNNRLNAANEQCDRVILNMVGNASSRYTANEIKKFYENNSHIKEILVLKGGKPIYVRYGQIKDKNFIDDFMKRWVR